MEDVSVSKGVFAHVPRKFGQKKKKNKNLDHINEPWYKAFKETWMAIENSATRVNVDTFKQILSDLESFVEKIKTMSLLTDEIPTGILLAGVNLPDHNLLLHKLEIQLQPITRYIATVWSRDASTLKNLTDEVVCQLINGSRSEDDSLLVKKSQCTFFTLQAWHQENNISNTPLVIIIPDFESFSYNILHDFILILSSYCNSIKFVLIFGVATTLHVVHRSLSYDATSKLKIQVFHTQKQVDSLSDVLDGIVLAPNIPFKLTGRAFKLLIDIFIWYDFSVKSYLQSYKVCVWRHFYGQNEKLICCDKESIKNRVSQLTPKDLKKLKALPSVERYFNSMDKTKFDSASNKQFQEILIKLLNEFHKYISDFLIILRCLHKVSVTLPTTPFGKNFRNIYTNAVFGNTNLCETEEYKRAIQLLGFLSKEELLTNIKSIIRILDDYESAPENIKDKLQEYMDLLRSASLEVAPFDLEVETEKIKLSSRTAFKTSLRQASLKVRSSPYKEMQIEFIKFLDNEVFQPYLKSPAHMPLNEIFCCDDPSIVHNYIRGSMKAVIHNGLRDPYLYLKCDCCSAEGEILQTHPDISILYKCHLESRKMINMYDWLQTFVITVDPNDRSNDDEVNPELYDRFSRAVAELQFLGFIKTTRKKTDHVKKLT
ncbi:origin recognition complex subunit 3 [Nasonia vitripennis]|uniref:Origin recognition complex subunit 3 n=1 Tax=Nasonia vitripennis TaxID=7425 RepID=A0A7M7H208_NASVI|nr:origin recognition complex subunit 3 [Nasonia vitripennis]